RHQSTPPTSATPTRSSPASTEPKTTAAAIATPMMCSRKMDASSASAGVSARGVSSVAATVARAYPRSRGEAPSATRGAALRRTDAATSVAPRSAAPHGALELQVGREDVLAGATFAPVLRMPATATAIAFGIEPHVVGDVAALHSSLARAEE